MFAAGVHCEGARVLRSLGLTLIGWVCGALVGGVVFFSPLAFRYMAPYVLGGWLFVILPHVLLVPRGHLLSHPLITPIYGALWGPGTGLLWIIPISWLRQRPQARSLGWRVRSPIESSGAGNNENETGMVCSLV